MRSPSKLLRKSEPAAPLDRTDLELLRLLANDGRLSNKQLAAKLRLAPSSTHVRRKRLEALGYLGTARHEVAPEAFGNHLEALVAVRMPQHSRALLDAFRLYLLALPEVVQLFHMAGEDDFLLHVRARDSEHLKRFALEALTTREEVSHLKTSLVFEHLPGSWPGLPDPDGGAGSRPAKLS